MYRYSDLVVWIYCYRHTAADVRFVAADVRFVSAKPHPDPRTVARDHAHTADGAVDDAPVANVDGDRVVLLGHARLRFVEVIGSVLFGPDKSRPRPPPLPPPPPRGGPPLGTGAEDHIARLDDARLAQPAALLPTLHGGRRRPRPLVVDRQRRRIAEAERREVLLELASEHVCLESDE